MEPVYATTDHLTNMATVGAPTVIPCEQARDNTAPTGVPRCTVELPAVATGLFPVDLTFKINPDADFYLDAITCILWEIIEPDPPDPRYLAWVDPQRCGAAPVYLEFYDTVAQRFWGSNLFHWSNLASTGRTPHYLAIPQYIAAGRTFVVKATNRSATRNFCINLQLHGRYKLSEAHYDGTMIAPKTFQYDQLQKVDAGVGYELVGNERLNYRGAGVSHSLVCPQVDQWEATSRRLTPANYDAPIQMPPLTVATHTDFGLMIRYINGMLGPTPANALGEGASIDMDAAMRWPVMVRVRDERNRYWLSRDFIPMASMCGWGGQPHILPVDWSWGNGGARILVDVMNLAYNPDDAGDFIRFGMNFEGWFIARK